MSIYIGFVTILAGALGNYLKFAFVRDKNGAPMINYDLILLNVPMLTIGTMIGLILNQVLPEIVICLVLIAVLIISFDKTYKRY